MFYIKFIFYKSMFIIKLFTNNNKILKKLIKFNFYLKFIILTFIKTTF